MIFKSKYKKKTVALYDPVLKKNITYDYLNREKNKKIYKNKRSLILILAENSAGFIITYFSFIQNNHPVMIISSLIDANELNATIKKFCPTMIVVGENFKLDKIKFKIDKVYSTNNYNIFKTRFKKKQTVNHKILLLLGTSGSTGNQKWVKLSKKNLISNLTSISKELKINNNDITITTMPPEYTYGLSIINSHLFNGAKIVLNNYSVVQKEFWKNLKLYKVSSFGGVPFMYEILDKLKFHNFLNKTNIKYLTQAGGKLDANLHEKINIGCQANKINFYVMYGSTETSPRMAVLKNPQIKKRYGSIGKPIYGTKMSIFKNKKKVLTPYVSGEIVFQGDNIFGGYAENYKDLKTFKDLNSYFTGDLGYYDNDGFFYVDGRKSRFIKIKGLRMNLDEMESKLKKNLNLECKILNKDNSLVLFIEKNLKNELEIKRKISRLSLVHNSDIIIKKIKNFPKTLRGKIDHKKLLKL